MRTGFLNPSMQVRVKKIQHHVIPVKFTRWVLIKTNVFLDGLVDGLRKHTGTPLGFLVKAVYLDKP